MIHPQLLADCHHLGRNSLVPWFILVPDTAETDLLDLPPTERAAVMEDCAAVSGFIKQVLGFPKVNVAGLGNVVPQMHLHVIGRREGDACWPQPVWGNLPEGGAYQDARLHEWLDELARVAGLVPVSASDGAASDGAA
jgi:diadenosine tetraphosphate (Ap4A) HIT family hydrolase